jgi:spermidine/putrescine transport system ATP-binding protein
MNPYYIKEKKVSNTIIEIKGLTKNFDDQQVLRGIDLNIHENEFLTLLGPSGCGKTTILRIIAGFEEPSQGEVLFSGEDLTKIPSYKREVNTVFQKYSLFPFLNVYDNVAFGLNLKKVDKEIIHEKVTKMLGLVGLQGFEKRDVTLLSGGQQQRVAIARALVNEPKVLLLDEPLGALDAKLRKEMQTELKKIQQEVGITFIFVTHDQEEALSMSDTVVVLNDGVIQQIGTPIDIYNEPENRFVANFIGESNIIEGTMLDDCLVKFDDVEFVCVDKGFKKNEEIEVVLRPEDIKIVDLKDGQLRGKVVSEVFKGVHYEYIVQTDKRDYKVHTTEFYNLGIEVGMRLDPDDIHVMYTMEY